MYTSSPSGAALRASACGEKDRAEPGGPETKNMAGENSRIPRAASSGWVAVTQGGWRSIASECSRSRELREREHTGVWEKIGEERSFFFF